MPMKQCDNCGAKFENHVTFCSVCGTPLPEEKNRRMIVVIVIVVLVILVAVVAFFTWNHLQAMKEDQNQAKETKTQTEAESEATVESDDVIHNTQLQTKEITAQPKTYQGQQYILEGSDRRYISSGEVQYLTDDELRLARNEIFARRGRIFDDPELSAYFSSKAWYRGTILPDDFSEDSLSKVEKANIEVIKAEEARR